MFIRRTDAESLLLLMVVVPRGDTTITVLIELEPFELSRARA